VLLSKQCRAESRARAEQTETSGKCTPSGYSAGPSPRCQQVAVRHLVRVKRELVVSRHRERHKIMAVVWASLWRGSFRFAHRSGAGGGNAWECAMAQGAAAGAVSRYGLRLLRLHRPQWQARGEEAGRVGAAAATAAEGHRPRHPAPCYVGR
jgi:hypothetical protein